MKQTTRLEPQLNQHLMASEKMEQAFRFLQLPLVEMSTQIQKELDRNPLLTLDESELESEDIQVLINQQHELPNDVNPPPEKELNFDENDYRIMRYLEQEIRMVLHGDMSPFGEQNEELIRHRSFQVDSVTHRPSLYENLMTEAKELFETPGDIAIAESVLGNLEESGLLLTPLEELCELYGLELRDVKRVLHAIQVNMTPPGIGAQSRRECALIQLERQGKKQSLAHQICERYFDEMLHNHIPKIAKGLGVSSETVHEGFNEIAKLTMHPAYHHQNELEAYITPDIYLVEEGDEVKIEVDEGPFAHLHFTPRYLKLLEQADLSPDARRYLKRKLTQGQWLIRTIDTRNTTLYRLGEAILKRQKDFLTLAEGKLAPMTMQEIADELELNESTIVRAVQNKYLASPRGILPLRSLFTGGYSTKRGETISSRTIKEMIKSLIDNEDRSSPLSDQTIAEKLAHKGVTCARRTVAKYRRSMGLGTANQRRHYS